MLSIRWERDQLNAECPEKFRDILGHQFVAGLDDRGKVDLVQVYLGANKSTVSYEEAKSAVEKAYQRFGEPSPFDNLNDQPSSPPPTPTLQSELVALLQSLRIPQAAPPSRDNPSYRPNYASGNSRDQIGRSSFYRGIYCHNCREKDHYSTSCPWLIISGAQRDANRRAIDELQGGSRQYPRRPGLAGPPLAPAVPAAVASGGGDREEQGGRRMNNIGGANVVILKRPTVEEADDNLEYPPTYPINAATRSQKKNLESKKFQPTSRVTRPAGRDSERALANQTSRNLNRLNNKTTPSPSFLPSPLDDEEMEESGTIGGDNYGMRGALPLGQDKRVQFVDQDDGVYDQPTPQYYQRKTPPPPRPQEATKIQVH